MLAVRRDSIFKCNELLSIMQDKYSNSDTSHVHFDILLRLYTFAIHLISIIKLRKGKTLNLYYGTCNDRITRKDFLSAFNCGSKGCIHISHKEHLIHYILHAPYSDNSFCMLA